MKGKILLVLGLVLCFNSAISQSIGASTGATAPVPEQVYWYEFVEPNGSSTENCNYNWITNGQSVFTTSDGSTVGPNYTKRVYIKWLNNIINNHTDGRKVTVTVSGCDVPGLNVIRELTVNTKYLPPPTFKTAGGSTITTLNVACYTPEITLRLEAIPDAEYYRWELPAGWSKTGSPGVNLFTTTSPTVDVTPGQGVTSTNIKAYSSIASFNGPITTLPVTRNADQISFTGSNPTVYCGSNAPVTYQVTAVGGLSLYNWTYPSGWSCQSGCTSRTITLVPDGSDVQGQSITARGSVICDGQTIQTNLASQAINFSTAVSPDFTLSGPKLVCTSGSNFSLSNVASGSPVTWQASPSNLFAVSSGSGVSASLAAASSATSGSGIITFTVGCSTPVPIQKTIWVGNPTITFVEKKCHAEEAVFEYSSPILEGVTYSWSINSIYLALNTYDHRCFVSGDPGLPPQPYVLTLQIQEGGCTTSKTKSGTYADCPGGGGHRLAAYPNPTSSELVVSYQEDSTQTSDALLKEAIKVELINIKSEKVYVKSTRDNTTKIPVDKLPEGIYYLRIINREGTIQRQIKIKH